MSLGQSLFNALKGRLIRSLFLLIAVGYLQKLTYEALLNCERYGKLRPFETIESAVFTLDVATVLNEIVDESPPEQEFLELEDVHGVRAFCTWANLVDLLIERLRNKGYSTVDRAFDDIVLAMVFLSFWSGLGFGPLLVGHDDVETLANIFQLVFEAISSNLEEEAGAAGPGKRRTAAGSRGAGPGKRRTAAGSRGAGPGKRRTAAGSRGAGPGKRRTAAGSRGAGPGKRRTAAGSRGAGPGKRRTAAGSRGAGPGKRRTAAGRRSNKRSYGCRKSSWR